MNLVQSTLEFGLVKIEWYLPPDMSPIGVWHEGLNGHQVYCLNCDLHYTIGDIHRVIPMFVGGRRFTFDGASIPRMLHWIPGFSPLGWHVWAVIPHDFACEHPELIGRHIADGMFIEILKALRPERYWQSVALFAGVRLWSVCKMLREHWVRRHRKKRARKIEWALIVAGLIVASVVLVVLHLKGCR